jgi:hypothetical protein
MPATGTELLHARVLEAAEGAFVVCVHARNLFRSISLILLPAVLRTDLHIAMRTGADERGERQVIGRLNLTYCFAL